MSDPHRPIWIVTDPAKPYPDGRFDGVKPRAHWNPDPDVERILDAIANEYWPETPPLDPQQPTPEEARVLSSIELTKAVIIADQARHAAANIETVFRHWGYIQTHPLPELRALLDMLTPPAPKWTATEEPE